MTKINPNFTAFPLFAVVTTEYRQDIPALFTSESDAEQLIAELKAEPLTAGEEYDIIEVVAIGDYYIDEEESD